jgi:hypothetical protein
MLIRVRRRTDDDPSQGGKLEALAELAYRPEE